MPTKLGGISDSFTAHLPLVCSEIFVNCQPTDLFPICYIIDLFSPTKQGLKSSKIHAKLQNLPAKFSSQKSPTIFKVLFPGPGK